MEEKEIPVLSAFQEQAFAARADLKSLEVQKQIAADQIRYTEGAFWPSRFRFRRLCRSRSVSRHRETSTGRASTQVRALNFPFFEGGLRKAEVPEAKARERQAALVLRGLEEGDRDRGPDRLPGSGHPEGDPPVSQRPDGLRPRQLSVPWRGSSNSVFPTASMSWMPTPSWCRRRGRWRRRSTITSLPSCG